MIRTVAIVCLAASSMLAGVAVAGPTLLQPGTQVPYTETTPQPVPMPGHAVPMQQPLEYQANYPPIEAEQPLQPYVVGHGPELYTNVIYRDVRRTHPCSVPYLIDVPMPQPRWARGCTTCKPCCVTIKVCVPPCGEPCVKVRRRGKKFIYDFGKYEVNIMIRPSGRIIVNYDA